MTEPEGASGVAAGGDEGVVGVEPGATGLVGEAGVTAEVVVGVLPGAADTADSVWAACKFSRRSAGASNAAAAGRCRNMKSKADGRAAILAQSGVK